MVGIKGHSGGARRGSGPRQKRLTLSSDAARELSIIVKHRRSINPELRAEEVVEQWIHEHWQELDALYQEKAE
jgi:hypothetical protein